MEGQSLETVDGTWIRFEERSWPGHKTRLFDVVAKEGECLLGQVKWYGPWRCYAFHVGPNTVFERKCMLEIVAFIDRVTAQRAEERHNENTDTDE